MNAVDFIDSPVTMEGYECPICLQSDLEHQSRFLRLWTFKKSSYFIVHEGEEGKKHPIHRECIKRWINEGHPSCPCCQIPIKNRLLTPFETICNTATLALEGAQMGANTAGDINIFGIAAVVTAAALVLLGDSAARDALALVGGGYALACLAGVISHFGGSVAGAQSRITVFAAVGATLSMLVNTYYLYTRETQQAYLCFAIAGYGFMKAAGFAKVSLAALTGAVAHSAREILFTSSPWDGALTTLTGGLGSLTGSLESRWEFNALPTLAGMRASHWAQGQHSHMTAAMIGCTVSGVVKSILVKAWGNAQTPAH